MAVPAGPTVKGHTGNGVSTIFTVPFLVIQPADLAVYVDGVRLTSGYTQSGVGNPISTVVFVTAPALNAPIVFELNVPFERLNDYQENGDFLADTVNRDFDRIWQALKQLLRYAGRALSLGQFDVDGQGWYRAKGNGIRDLRDPTQAQDAATKQWSEDFVSGILATGQGPINNAANVVVTKPSGEIGTVQQMADDLRGSYAVGAGNLYLATFFGSNSDTSISFYASFDGANFSRITSPMASNGVEFKGRDPSLLYKDGIFYVAVTNYLADDHDFAVWRSRDLISWTLTNVNLGSLPVCSTTTSAPGGSAPCARVWAPEWYEDAGEIYILVSLQYAANALDVDGVSIPFFRPFASRCTDLHNLEFELPVELDLSGDAGNKIDPAMIRIGVNIYMAIKDEYGKLIEVYTSTSVTGPWTPVSVLSQSRIEGPCITKVGDKYRIYFDSYSLGATGYVDTEDFLSFTAENFLNVGALHRHGTVISLDGLSDFDQNYVRARAINVNAFASQGLYDSSPRLNLGSGAVSITPYEGAIYSVSGTAVVTLTIEAQTANEFFLQVRSDSANAAILIPNHTNFAPADATLDVIGYGNYRNRLIRVRRDSADGKYRIEGLPGTRGSGAFVGLVSDAGSKNINSGPITWTPKHEWTYTTSASDTGEVVINAIGSMPEGFKFNILVLSGTNDGAIRLKSAGFSIGGRDALFRGDFGYDGMVVRVVRASNAWHVVGKTELCNAVTYDPPSIPAASEDTTTVSVPGAVVGDFVEVAFSQAIGVIELDAYVSAAGTVTVRFRNRSGGAINLSSGSLRVRVRR